MSDISKLELQFAALFAFASAADEKIWGEFCSGPYEPDAAIITAGVVLEALRTKAISDAIPVNLELERAIDAGYCVTRDWNQPGLWVWINDSQSIACDESFNSRADAWVDAIANMKAQP